ncbi:NRN1 protein, partial [Rhadina sibilatrix]|nr:NRN1 protein [Rhadina sibilatrix]
MGLKLNGSYISLILAVQIETPKLVRIAGNYPRKANLLAAYRALATDQGSLSLPCCRYWDDFHACTLTALTDCQEGATDLWEKLRRESKNLDFQGSLFELCGGGSGAAPSLLSPALPLLLAALWAALVTWLPF